MYRRRSKRTQRVLFTLTYTLVPLLIVGIVTLLVLLIQGYRFDTNDNHVYQAGLVQFSTTPTGATVSVDGAALMAKTRTRINVSSGVRTIDMIKDGYVPWQKSVTVEPGSVLWLTYARLVPETIVPETRYTYSSVGKTLVHPSQHLFGLQTSKTSPTFVTIKADDGSSEQSSSTLPSSLYDSSTNQTFTPTEWGESGRYVLIRHDSGIKRDWLLLDRDNVTSSFNLSRESNLEISSALFDPSDDRYIYMTAGGSLQRFDISEKTTSALLAKNVINMTRSFKGNIAVTSRVASGKTSMSYVTHGAKVSRSIAFEGVNNARSAAIVTYDYHQYVSALSGNHLFVTKTSIGSSDDSGVLQLSPTITLAVPKTTTAVEPSPNGRFIVVRGPQGLYVYDLETTKLTQFSMETTSGELRWIDDYHILDRANGKLIMLEFDGANATPILDVPSNYSTVLSNSGRYLYTLQQSKTGYAIVRVKMT